MNLLQSYTEPGQHTYTFYDRSYTFPGLKNEGRKITQKHQGFFIFSSFIYHNMSYETSRHRLAGCNKATVEEV